MFYTSLNLQNSKSLISPQGNEIGRFQGGVAIYEDTAAKSGICNQNHHCMYYDDVNVLLSPDENEIGRFQGGMAISGDLLDKSSTYWWPT